jgi:ABC-2 type transport system ATP-binding protein
MNEYILQCRDLGKNFSGRAALFGINMDIPRGRIIGLLGPNGSGKTTFMKLANGLLVPSHGSITINGYKPGPETKKAVSYLPDKDYLPEWMKVSELVKMFTEFYEDFDSARAYEMLERLGISDRQPLKSLSKGTKEKVQLILAMSRQAELYMLDEPIGGVDPAARDYILNTIINNYSENSTVIISTHLIADVEQVLDDVIMIKYGSIAACSSVDEIRENYGKSVDEYFREVFRC